MRALSAYDAHVMARALYAVLAASAAADGREKWGDWDEKGDWYKQIWYKRALALIKYFNSQEGSLVAGPCVEDKELYFEVFEGNTTEDYIQMAVAYAIWENSGHEID